MVVKQEKKRHRSPTGQPRFRATSRGGYVNTGFSVSPRLYAALRALAERELTTMGSVIRQACAQHVAAAGFRE